MKRIGRYITGISILLLLIPDCQAAGDEESLYLRIMSYNVENLFDTKDDPQKDDDDFTPEGAQRWSYYRYRNKLSKIAQVISAIGEWGVPAIAGLVEVENDSCLYDLCKWHLGRHYPYGYILEDGPDERGIDPGVLYDTTALQLIEKESIRVVKGGDERPTRDILYGHFAIVDGSGTAYQNLHIYLCHFPSQRGGAAETEDKRRMARNALKEHVDSLLQAEPEAWIIAMGDFNTAPADNIAPLKNLMTGYLKKDEGTHKFHGKWSCLDQFYVSASVLPYLGTAHIFAPPWLLQDDEKYMGREPRRTYVGPRYAGGYSDHLPIYIDLKVR